MTMEWTAGPRAKAGKGHVTLGRRGYMAKGREDHMTGGTTESHDRETGRAM